MKGPQCWGRKWRLQLCCRYNKDSSTSRGVALVVPREGRMRLSTAFSAGDLSANTVSSRAAMHCTAIFSASCARVSSSSVISELRNSFPSLREVRAEGWSVLSPRCVGAAARRAGLSPLHCEAQLSCRPVCFLQHKFSAPSKNKKRQKAESKRPWGYPVAVSVSNLCLMLGMI